MDARGLTRQRIQAVLDELKEVGPSVIPAILAAVDRTQDEALRFQLWEAACNLVMAAVADAAAARLREPGRHFGLGLGLEALSAASAIPEPVLTSGLGISEEDLRVFNRWLKQGEYGWTTYKGIHDIRKLYGAQIVQATGSSPRSCWATLIQKSPRITTLPCAVFRMWR